MRRGDIVQDVVGSVYDICFLRVYHRNRLNYILLRPIIQHRRIRLNLPFENFQHTGFMLILSLTRLFSLSIISPKVLENYGCCYCND